MLHRCDGAVVCDIVGHVVGDRLDLGHGVAHGDSRLDGSEHAQVVARIAKAKVRAFPSRPRYVSARATPTPLLMPLGLSSRFWPPVLQASK